MQHLLTENQKKLIRKQITTTQNETNEVSMLTPQLEDVTPQRDSSAATSFLLRILTDEIARDGGACLVTTLKDYIIDGNGHKEPLEVRSSTPREKRSCNKNKKRRNQQLNSLLTHSNVGKPKLLAFLESHRSVFRVNRGMVPHWVQLVATEISRTNNNLPIDEAHRENLRTKVFQKALYVLRKRTARIDRRRKLNPNENALDPTIDEQVDTGVFCHWLLRQCSWELHFLLRYCGFYMDPTFSGYETPGDVKQVGSREWEDVAICVFERLLRVGRENTSCNDSPSHLVIFSWIRVRDGKALLQQSCLEKDYQRQIDVDSYDGDTRFDFIVWPSLVVEEGDGTGACEEEKPEDIWENRGDHNEDGDETMLSLVRRIDQTLTEIVCQKDGGHQVSLQLLLHRYPHFRELLGGRDLWTLYCDFSDREHENSSRTIENKNPKYPSFFESISMFHNGTNLILRSNRSKTIDGNSNAIWGKRMMVDEEGLYSVTNNKWGRAMSNLVIQACRQKNIFGEQLHSAAFVDDHGQEEVQQEYEGVTESASSTGTSIAIRMVIDLTASVGGMTLALAKSNFFDRILALEIDEGRAALCRENLGRHGFHDNSATMNGTGIVEVRHQDSVEQIPFLPRRACFVIDPPWGGYDYKEKVRRQQQQQGKPLLKLGDTSLEDVLAMISLHNSPCVVGLRLPTNFAAIDFLHALRESNERIQFECLTRRKISVQLFVVLYFSPQAGLNA